MLLAALYEIKETIKLKTTDGLSLKINMKTALMLVILVLLMFIYSIDQIINKKLTIVSHWSQIFCSL